MAPIKKFYINFVGPVVANPMTPHSTPQIHYPAVG